MCSKVAKAVKAETEQDRFAQVPRWLALYRESGRRRIFAPELFKTGISSPRTGRRGAGRGEAPGERRQRLERPQIALGSAVGVGSRRRTGHAGLVSSWLVPERPPSGVKKISFCAADPGAPQIRPAWLLPRPLSERGFGPPGDRWHSVRDLPFELALVAMVVYYLAVDKAASARG